VIRRVFLFALIGVMATRMAGAAMIDDTPMIAELTRSMTGLLASGTYDVLESTARGAWQRRERTPSAGWMLGEIMQALAKLPDEATSADWNDRIAALQRWHASAPGSELASEALAMGYVNWAWYARGTGYASTVTESGSNDFEDRLNVARELLEATAGLPDPTPQRTMAMLSVGLGLGWEMDRLNQVANTGLALEPTYVPILGAMVNAMLPRWHGGSPQEWEHYAHSAASKNGRWDMYALMICRVLGLGDNGDDLRGVVSWRLARKGFDQLDREFPDSLKLWSERANLAVILGEGTGAADAFDHLAGAHDPTVFRNEEQLLKCISWAGQAREYEQHVLPMKWAAYGGMTLFVLLLISALVYRWLKKPI